MAQLVKNHPTNAGDTKDPGLIPGSGRSPGVGNGNPLQYSYLENPMDRGAWWDSPWGCKQLDMTEHALPYLPLHCEMNMNTAMSILAGKYAKYIARLFINTQGWRLCTVLQMWNFNNTKEIVFIHIKNSSTVLKELCSISDSFAQISFFSKRNS